MGAGQGQKMEVVMAGSTRKSHYNGIKTMSQTMPKSSPFLKVG
jgi:hypothetical protein